MGQDEYGRIDFVMGGSNGGWTALRYKTGSTVADDGALSSDHRPVIVELALGAS